KQSIREIRINENPFSAEYDHVGLSRIEILTKPGTEKFQGQSYFNFNDESLNSRNPFAPYRAPYQSRLFGGNLSGPILPGRATFFVDFERQEVDGNAVLNATILDNDLREAPLSLALVVPERRMIVGPRLDWQLNSSNTLVARYSFTRSELR